MVGRIMVLLAIGVAGYVGINPPGFVAEVVAFAFGLAAASFFPVLVLGVFSRRVNRNGIVAGMLSGIVFTGGYIIGEKFLGVPFRSILGPCYICSEGIGVLGCALNFAVAITVSHLTGPPSDDVVNSVDKLRQPEEAIE